MAWWWSVVVSSAAFASPNVMASHYGIVSLAAGGSMRSHRLSTTTPFWHTSEMGKWKYVLLYLTRSCPCACLPVAYLALPWEKYMSSFFLCLCLYLEKKTSPHLPLPCPSLPFAFSTQTRLQACGCRSSRVILSHECIILCLYLLSVLSSRLSGFIIQTVTGKH